MDLRHCARGSLTLEFALWTFAALLTCGAILGNLRQSLTDYTNHLFAPQASDLQQPLMESNP